MKRTKRIINIVFITLNILVIASAVIVMIVKKQNQVTVPWGSLQWILPGMMFIPALIVINIVWLIVWCVKVKNKERESESNRGGNTE